MKSWRRCHPYKSPPSPPPVKHASWFSWPLRRRYCAAVTSRTSHSRRSRFLSTRCVRIDAAKLTHASELSQFVIETKSRVVSSTIRVDWAASPVPRRPCRPVQKRQQGPQAIALGVLFCSDDAWCDRRCRCCWPALRVGRASSSVLHCPGKPHPC
jgi:hypothetical protein